MDIKSKIRVIEDFPKDGISFKDITTLAKDGEAFKATIDMIVEHLKDKNIDLIASPEARGFIFGFPVAYALGIGVVPVRKKGKLPAETIEVSYGLEYGSDILEIHEDAIKEGQRVAIVDDLLATGGTTEATIELVKKAGGEVVSLDFAIELTGLKGREKFKDYDVFSIVDYEF